MRVTLFACLAAAAAPQPRVGLLVGVLVGCVLAGCTDGEASGRAIGHESTPTLSSVATTAPSSTTTPATAATPSANLCSAFWDHVRTYDWRFPLPDNGAFEAVLSNLADVDDVAELFGVIASEAGSDIVGAAASTHDWFNSIDQDEYDRRGDAGGLPSVRWADGTGHEDALRQVVEHVESGCPVPADVLDWG